MASDVGICDASSKMTMSNMALSACKYWETVIGLISIQGATTRKSSGISSNSFLSPMPRRLLLASR